MPAGANAGVQVSAKAYQPGVYALTLRATDNGCPFNRKAEQQYSITFQECPDPIWPGDLNGDGTVNYRDIVTLGLRYGKTGARRQLSRIDWNPKLANAWATDAFAVFNASHTDANGDGQINMQDLIAVQQHYGKKVFNKQTGAHGTSDNLTGNGIPLRIRFAKDQAEMGERVGFTIELGDSAFPATDVYAVAFRLNAPSGMIQPGSINLTPTNSWLGGTQDVISIAQPNNLHTDFAITRKDQVHKSGTGTIATGDVVMIEQLVQKYEYDVAFLLEFLEVEILTASGNLLPAETILDTLTLRVVEKAGTSGRIVEGSIPGLQAYPSPTNGVVKISADVKISAIIIRNLEGKVVFLPKEIPNSNTTMLDLSTLPSGVYYILIKSEDNVQQTLPVVVK
jgi:hypothetical protein